MSSSDEEAVRGPGRNAASDANDSGDDNKSPYGAGNDNLDDDNDADLFGSDGDDNGLDNDQPHRTLDDEELDSGDDENRYDRMDETMDGAADSRVDYKTLTVQDVDLSRAPALTTHNGEVSTLHIPEFLSVESEEFNPETYIAPSYSTAATSLCWRYDPKDGSLLQSNARIIEWSDGSLTLQLASSPLEQYRIESKPFVKLGKNGEYDVKLDSHVYLGAAIETATMFRLVAHVKNGLTVLPTTMETDDAVRRLQESLAAAARSGKKTADGTAPIIENDEDPMLGQRRAEAMERDAARAERRRQQIADREAERGERGRRGPLSRPSGGISIGDLEGGLSTRPRAKPRRPTNRRGEINTDDEEDYGRGGRTREDEYDEDDGFLVGSDEEIEEEEDEEEEEELEDEDADAEGEVDEEVAPKPSRSKPEPEPTQTGSGSPPARKKNRYVVDDEDEDE